MESDAQATFLRKTKDPLKPAVFPTVEMSAKVAESTNLLSFAASSLKRAEHLTPEQREATDNRGRDLRSIDFWIGVLCNEAKCDQERMRRKLAKCVLILDSGLAHLIGPVPSQAVGSASASIADGVIRGSGEFRTQLSG